MAELQPSSLTAYHLRYTIQATEALELEQHPGSALRGSLFQARLKRFCVNQEAPECASCPLGQTCPVSALGQELFSSAAAGTAHWGLRGHS